MLLKRSQSLNCTYKAALIWNIVREVLKLDEFYNKVSSPKTSIKNKILKLHAEGESIEWEQCSWNSFRYKLNAYQLIYLGIYKPCY